MKQNLPNPAITEEDREDDDDDMAEENQKEEEPEEPYKFEDEEEEEKDEGGINLADLRVSMPVFINDQSDTIKAFETILKEAFGGAKVEKALDLIKKYKGDRYQQAEHLINTLSNEVFSNNMEQAESCLHQCQSFLLMRDGIMSAQVSF